MLSALLIDFAYLNNQSIFTKLQHCEQIRRNQVFQEERIHFEFQRLDGRTGQSFSFCQAQSVCKGLSWLVAQWWLWIVLRLWYRSPAAICYFFDYRLLTD